MSEVVSAVVVGPCACVGPAGDCPCLRRARGEKVEITETYISPSLFARLSDEDKTQINNLKNKALDLFFAERKKTAEHAERSPQLQFTLDTCPQGHLFLALPDHPKDGHFKNHCPHCVLKALADLQDHRASSHAF